MKLLPTPHQDVDPINESTQTQLTASAIIRELNREIDRARFRKDGQKLEPKDYIDALDEAAPAAWSVTYTRYDDFGGKKLKYSMAFLIFILDLIVPYIGWDIFFHKFRTNARLTIRAEDKELISEGTAKGEGDLTQKKALAQAVHNLIKKHNPTDTYAQESKPGFS